MARCRGRLGREIGPITKQRHMSPSVALGGSLIGNGIIVGTLCVYYYLAAVILESQRMEDSHGGSAWRRPVIDHV